MMKQGIITAKFGTEPNKELTKEECETLIDTVYDYFAQNVMVTVGGKEIRVGVNVSTILDTFGEPNRIDRQNTDLNGMFMIQTIRNFVW